MIHAKLSPSKRRQWAKCPGSVREESKYPDDRSSPVAIDGTHSHTLLEHCVKGGLADPTLMVGLTMSDEDGQFTVDDARAARVKVAIDYIKDRVSVINGDVIAERRVDPAWLTGREDLSGTVDVQIDSRASRVLDIIDYKDGMNPVDAVGNDQLEQYAIGKLAECGLAYNVPDRYPWDVVRMTIIQPKIAVKGLNPISHWEVSVSDLLTASSKLIHEARMTDDPNAPLIPGEVQCKYCRAKGSCSALANGAMEKVGVSFPVVSPDLPSTLDVANQVANKDPTTMDSGQLRQILEAAPLIRQMLEAAEKEALRRLNNGQQVPGFKLVNGRGTRAWALSDDEMVERLRKLGIPKDKTHVTKLVSPAQVEKLTWEKRDGTKVQLTDRQLKRLKDEYITTVAGKPTVVPESDSRQAIVTSAASMFGAVGNEASSLPSWLV